MVPFSVVVVVINMNLYLIVEVQAVRGNMTLPHGSGKVVIYERLFI